MELNKYIEHTLLKPDTTTLDVKELCEEAIENNFAAVCVPPFFVKTAAQLLKGKDIKVITTIGYPMGYNAIPAKVEETKRAIGEGADEVEMVVNISAIKDGAWAYVRNDIDSVSTVAHLKSKKTRVIFETGLLTGTEIKKLCEICIDLQIDCIKNATGVNAGGASLEMIAFLKENAQSLKVAASGGIHDKAFAQELIGAGASRLGTSSGVKLIK